MTPGAWKSTSHYGLEARQSRSEPHRNDELGQPRAGVLSLRATKPAKAMLFGVPSNRRVAFSESGMT